MLILKLFISIYLISVSSKYRYNIKKRKKMLKGLASQLMYYLLRQLHNCINILIKLVVIVFFIVVSTEPTGIKKGCVIG